MASCPECARRGRPALPRSSGFGDAPAARLRPQAAWRRCPLGLGLDVAGSVVSRLVGAVASCDAADSDSSGPDSCAAAEALVRSVGAERLRDASDADRGYVGRFGCLRSIPGYCELLETSETCDLGGCG
ncbi:MAG: hypothetical protein HY905_09555 [Deltaproteobacteria bacterium]|nr:hypothetical protein [Deltaproteobacteria bacterium]